MGIARPSSLLAQRAVADSPRWTRAGKDNLAIPFIGWMSQEGIDLRRLLKKPASKAAADESTGGVASGLR